MSEEENNLKIMNEEENNLKIMNCDDCKLFPNWAKKLCKEKGCLYVAEQ